MKLCLMIGLSLLLGTGIVYAATSNVPAATDEEGYRLPTPHPSLRFPRDHGSHPEFKIEWWYITGHLREDKRPEPWGFQATFFRYALHPHATSTASPAFGTNHLFMAHMALVDAQIGSFVHEERLNRNGWDAFARVGDLDLRNGNWHLRRREGESMELAGTVQGKATFELNLTPVKSKVLFGKDGLSRKGSAPSAASWYITFPRLAVHGTLAVDGRAREVTGEAWMDHEISSSQLDEGQVGWDWASLRLNDGREVMVYVMRTADGTPDGFSTLAWIDRDGNVTHRGPDEFTWAARRVWISPDTGGAYPIDIEISTLDPERNEPVRFQLRPLSDAQEMIGHLGGISYWEGACEIIDAQGHTIGEAYVELTGYAKELGSALQ